MHKIILVITYIFRHSFGKRLGDVQMLVDFVLSMKISFKSEKLSHKTKKTVSIS